MATIADLLARLEHGAITLGPPDTTSGLEAHVTGWMLLGERTQRAVSLLPLGGRPERVGVGLQTVLRPLARGPRHRVDATVPLAALADMALTVGAISDVLADNLRRQQRSEYVGREAVKLQASLLAPVHLAARWSRAGLERPDPHNRVSTRRLLDDLAAVTEPWALIPPASRGSVLEDFRIRTSSAPGLEGAVAAWADEALLVLHERHRLSGWAMQAIAGSLALIGATALQAIQRLASEARLNPDHARASAETLTEAEREWRAAAAWPPYVRLGGSVTDLRILTRELQHDLAHEPPQTLTEVRGLLRSALPVGQGHAAAMESLVLKHELWVHGPSLGSSAGYIPGWEREPWWSHQGAPLTRAAQAGLCALDQASVALAAEPAQPTKGPPSLGWPPASRQLALPPHSRVRGLRPAIRPGPDR